MIISHKYKFIFVHCRKAAGSSIITSLSRYLGNEDLQFSGITDCRKLNLYPPRRVVIESLAFMSYKDYLSILTGRRSLWGLISKSFKRKYAGKLGPNVAHAPASNVAKTFPKEWASYFKFCVVRNPWDKTLSDYFWKTKGMKNPPSFEDFVKSLRVDDLSLIEIKPTNHNNWLMYTIDDKIAVDYIVRFEDLENGLSEAIANTSLNWDGWLPHMKKRNPLQEKNEISKNYRDFYTNETAQIVNDLYVKEIDNFNYKF